MPVNRKLPNFRSSRILIPNVVSPVMTSNYVKVNKEDPHIVLDAEEGEELHNYYNYVKVTASDYIEGNEPYRAFQQNEQGPGWMCPIPQGDYAWIALEPGLNWRSPNENVRFHISKIEVINRFFEDEICKQFAFQGKIGIMDWETIRVCKVPKLTGYYKSAFEIEYEGEYDQFRLLIQVPNGQTNVGFTTINMYFFANDHDELTFDSVNVKNRRFPRFFEKLYVNNDGADGIVWEKKHDNSMLVSVTSWYPGYYSSTSHATTIVHPHDRFYQKEGSRWREYNNGPFLVGHGGKAWGESVCRSKNYIVLMEGAYYYAYYNVYQWSVNGRDWVNRVRTDYNGFWMGGKAGFGTKNDIGLIFSGGYARGVELTADGRLQIHTYGEYSASNTCGDVATIGTYIGEHNLQYYRFIDNEGHVYNSPLQAQYQYTDMSESDPAKRVKTTSCSWRFGYAEGKYYAAAKHNTMYYYNDVLRRWQWLSRFVLLSSTDGFRTYTVAKEVDPCPEYRYSDFGFAAKDDGGGNKLRLIERYRELDGNGNITNYYHTKIDDVEHADYVDVPMIGFNSDPAYSAIRVRFSNRVTNGGDSSIRVDDFPVNANSNVAYIEKGRPACPRYFGIPTAFRKNSWSSNSYDEGGFIFFDGDGENFAYGINNYMIDKHNYTFNNIR